MQSNSVLIIVKPKLVKFMQFFLICSDPQKAGRTQLLRVMKLTAVFLLAACLQVTANGYSQKVTLKMKDASLEQVFREIRKQSGFLFLYNNEELNKVKRVSIDVTNVDVRVAMNEAL